MSILQDARKLVAVSPVIGSLRRLRVMATFMGRRSLKKPISLSALLGTSDARTDTVSCVLSACCFSFRQVVFGLRPCGSRTLSGTRPAPVQRSGGTWEAGHPKTTCDPLPPYSTNKYFAGCLAIDVQSVIF